MAGIRASALSRDAEAPMGEHDCRALFQPPSGEGPKPRPCSSRWLDSISVTSNEFSRIAFAHLVLYLLAEPGEQLGVDPCLDGSSVETHCSPSGRIVARARVGERDVSIELLLEGGLGREEAPREF